MEEGHAGRLVAASDYIKGQWREHSIRSARFAPCPHCGGAVSGRERRWNRWSTHETMVFFSARCTRVGCGWQYTAHSGTRDEFVAACNRRSI